MIIRVNNKKYSFEGYVFPINSVQKIANDCYKQGRADANNEVKKLIKTRLIDNLSLEDATKYGNRDASQQANSYSTVMKYEIADCVDDLLDDLEQLKE